ncbi:copper homeostasis protein CutC [Roseateles sp. DXS20W]|uniref:PF03932 family protein CutC n=1 Tax=Pelomonas lactea TaxID=3299030 RepID=A0ABW7GIB1_9BURK
MTRLEVCVDDVAGLEAAIQGGADRIELCSNLASGGLTPSAGFMAEASRLPIPVVALIRPRAGDFMYSATEARIMARDIELAAELGLAGVAVGALTPDSRLDLPLLQRLADRAAGMALTLHRAFDLTRDPAAALEDAIALGFQRVLTSGGARTAIEGAARLASLVAQSQGRIGILASSGIDADNVDALVRLTLVPEVHASCRAPANADPALSALGFQSDRCAATSWTRVRELKGRLARLGQAA